MMHYAQTTRQQHAHLSCCCHGYHSLEHTQVNTQLQDLTDVLPCMLDYDVQFPVKFTMQAQEACE